MSIIFYFSKRYTHPILVLCLLISFEHDVHFTSKWKPFFLYCVHFSDPSMWRHYWAQQLQAFTSIFLVLQNVLQILEKCRPSSSLVLWLWTPKPGREQTLFSFQMTGIALLYWKQGKLPGVFLFSSWQTDRQAHNIYIHITGLLWKPCSSFFSCSKHI